MKILVVGDLHADANTVDKVSSAAYNNDVEEIWQVGDFGYWPRFEGGRRFLKLINQHIEVPIFFADGNHEDHSLLIQDDSVRRIHGVIHHVPRGVVRAVDGKRVMFFGGAHSVDRTYRTQGQTWFPEEVPSAAEWNRALDEDPVDIVVAHDAPSLIDYGYPPYNEAFWPVEDLIKSDKFRRDITHELLPAITPRLWFNGHHHRRKTLITDDIQIETLNQGPEDGFMVTLDTKTMKVTDV